MPETLKPEQWPVQSQPTHRKCKGDENQWHMCYWHETNQCLVSKQGRKQITGTITYSKSAAKMLGLRKQDNTNGVCWWHSTDHYVVEKYVMFSKN